MKEKHMPKLWHWHKLYNMQKCLPLEGCHGQPFKESCSCQSPAPDILKNQDPDVFNLFSFVV